MRTQIITITICVICLIASIVYYSNELRNQGEIIKKLKSDNVVKESQISSSSAELSNLKKRLDDKNVALSMAKSNLAAVKADFDETKVELKESRNEVDEVKREMYRLKSLLNDTNVRSDALESRSSEQFDTSESAQVELVRQLKSEIKKQDIKIQEVGGKLKLSLSNKILFASAQTNLTDEGLVVLERLGHILKGIDNRLIRVEGHTDNLKIRYRLKEKYPSNWELSAARATNVVRFLINKVGIDPKRVYAVGMSKYHPVADNATQQGRSLNRRIEIMLEPIVEVKEMRELQLVDEVNKNNEKLTEEERDSEVSTQGIVSDVDVNGLDSAKREEFSNLEEPQLVIENGENSSDVKRFTVSNKMITDVDENSKTLENPPSYSRGHSKGGVGYIWVKKRITDFSSE